MRCPAFRQQGELKPQQPEIAHVDEKPVNQHKACCQRPPDLVSDNQQDQGTENDKEHPRHQINQKEGIAHAGYAKKVQKHKGPPKGEGFRLLFYSPASTARFRAGRLTAILRSAAPKPKPPFYKPPSLIGLSFFLRPQPELSKKRAKSAGAGWILFFYLIFRMLDTSAGGANIFAKTDNL
jgi:hypothetical protein